MLKISAKLKWGYPEQKRQVQVGGLNAGVVAENCLLLMQSVVDLVWSQVYRTERPPYLFAARSP